MNSIFEPSEYVQIIPLNILCTLLPQKVEIGIRNGTVLSRLYENGAGGDQLWGPGGKAALSLPRLSLGNTGHPREGAGDSDTCDHERFRRWVRHREALGT